MTRWGKAGVRLTEQQMTSRGHAATTRRNKRKLERLADDRIAYRLWRSGELKPHLITAALDFKKLYGPEVDLACGAKEPDVDLWEAGKLYPTWEQLLLLAKLVEKTPRFLCGKHVPLQIAQTSMRFHVLDVPAPPPVWSFEPEAVAATVAGTPVEMPEEGS